MTRCITRTLLCITILSATSLTVSAAAKKKKTRKPVDVNKAMATVLPKAVVGGTLERALMQLSDLAGVAVLGDWTALDKIGVKRSTKVSVRLEKTAAGKVLDVILVRVAPKGHPLAWHPYSGVVLVTTQKRALARKSRTRVRRAAAPTAKKIKTTRFKNYSFTDEPFANIITTLRRASGVNIHVNWRALALSGVEKDTPVTLRLRSITTSRALDMITEQLSTEKDKFESIYWVVDRGVLTITTGTALNAKTMVTVQDIADLILSPPNFKGPRLGRSTRGAGDTSSEDTGIFDAGSTTETTEEGTSAADRRAEAKASLEGIIKDSIGEDMWTSGGGKGSIRFFRNQMIISQTYLGYKLLAKAGVMNVFR